MIREHNTVVVVKDHTIRVIREGSGLVGTSVLKNIGKNNPQTCVAESSWCSCPSNSKIDPFKFYYYFHSMGVPLLRFNEPHHRGSSDTESDDDNGSWYHRHMLHPHQQISKNWPKGDSGSIYSTQGRGRGGVSQGLPNFLEAKFNYLISFI